MAAPYQNYATGTFLSDLVTRPEFLSYLMQEVYESSAFVQSGIISRNPALDARAGATRVTVPFFLPLTGNTEEVIKSTDDWGASEAGYLTPHKITGDSQVMTILHRGNAYAADDLSKLGTGTDPMGAIRSYLASDLNKKRTATTVHLDGSDDLEVDMIVVSVGRRPRTNDLMSEGTGVEINERGFVVADGYMRTANPRVFAVGDVVAGTPQLAHVGFAEAVVAIKTILGEPVTPVNNERVPWAIYSIPEVAFCGLT